MKNEVLICDSSRSLGKMISRRLMSMGLPSDCCKNAISEIRSCIFAVSYSVVIIFAFRPDEKLLELVAQAEKRGAAVFAGIFAPSSATFKRFLQAGARKCFPMPYPTGELCRIVIQNLALPAAAAAEPDIFLEELGFPRELRGFHYLCRAAELCTEAPQRIWESLAALYEDIAACFGTKASLVERSLRNLSASAFRNGAILRLTEGRLLRKPTNTELICAVCDMLAKQRESSGKYNKKHYMD